MVKPAYLLIAAAILFLAGPAFAHAIGGKDAAFVAATTGPDPFPFIYLGAKHMVTGYDHLAFLVGVTFFLYRILLPPSHAGIEVRCGSLRCVTRAHEAQ